MKKRFFLQAGAATVSIAWLSRYLPGRAKVMAASNDVFEITKTNEIDN
jgi:peptide-methionine (R)-S-oxide reductase